MKKRIVAIILLICVMVSALSVSASAAYAPKYTEYADVLFGLDMFRGSGICSDGTPAYELERGMTRAECIVMLLRLLGEEYEGEAYNGNHPFKDIRGHWATNYIAYAYAKGYTQGTGADTFSPDAKVTGKMYLTFLLRVLGYNDKAGDFEYNTAYKTAADLDVCPKGAYTTDGAFYRDDCVYTSYNALCTKMKNSDGTLLDALVAKGAVSETNAKIFYLCGDPTDGENLLDLSVFYHTEFGFVKIKNLFPRGYWRDDVGYTTTSFAGEKFGQIAFAFENGTHKPCTGASGRLRQIMTDPSRTYSVADLAKAIGGEIKSDRIEARIGGATLTIFPNNGMYDINSTFIYKVGDVEETENTEMTNFEAQEILKEYWGRNCAAGGAWMYFVDLSGDGIDEMLSIVFDAEWGDGVATVYMIVDGNVVNVADMGSSSMTSYQIDYHLYNENGKNYILEYNSFMRQGYGEIYYKIYSFNAAGDVVMLCENSYSGNMMTAEAEAKSDEIYREYLNYKQGTLGILYQTLYGATSDLW